MLECLLSGPPKKVHLSSGNSHFCTEDIIRRRSRCADRINRESKMTKDSRLHTLLQLMQISYSKATGMQSHATISELMSLEPISEKSYRMNLSPWFPRRSKSPQSLGTNTQPCVVDYTCRARSAQVAGRTPPLGLYRDHLRYGLNS